MSLLRAAKNFRRDVGLRLYGNNLGFRINALHYAYRLLSRWNFRLANGAAIPDQATRQAEELARRGFLVLPPVLPREDVAIMAKDMDHAYQTSKSVVSTLKDDGLLHLKDGLDIVPQLEKILQQPSVQNVVSAYFKSHFRPFRFEVYRTLPCQKQVEGFYSVYWHTDNVPRDTLKAMIYLNDTKKEIGAITLVPKDVSEDLRRRGFSDRFKVNPFLPDIEKSQVVVEGEAGTVILFAGQFCIHKATHPEYGHRDVATFLVYPSLKPYAPLSATERTRISRTLGHLRNPFTGAPSERAND